MAKGPAPDEGQCDGADERHLRREHAHQWGHRDPRGVDRRRGCRSTHYFATEDGFDGGNVQLSVNGGAFAPIPAVGLHLQRAAGAAHGAGGNTNPLAGQHAFSGSDPGSVFGSWGESQIDLAAAGVDPGDTIKVPLRRRS